MQEQDGESGTYKRLLVVVIHEIGNSPIICIISPQQMVKLHKQIVKSRRPEEFMNSQYFGLFQYFDCLGNIELNNIVKENLECKKNLSILLKHNFWSGTIVL